MSKRVSELFLFDIYIAILKIEFVKNRFEDSEKLLYDFVSWDSIIREFEIIGEAAKILINHNMIPKEYGVIVGFRNKIIHHYFGIDSEAVWNIIEKNLPIFKELIVEKIDLIEDDLKVRLVNSFIEDNKKFPFIVESINKL